MQNATKQLNEKWPGPIRNHQSARETKSCMKQRRERREEQGKDRNKNLDKEKNVVGKKKRESGKG